MSSPEINVSQLTLFNPARMRDADVIATFVARESVFSKLLADIASETPNGRAQHHLIIGQRGMGKSTLLARLAAELRRDPDLSRRFVPLGFAEEQFAVDRMSKFWLNCLDSLADAAERTGNSVASSQIDATVQKLRRQSGGIGEKDELPARAALDAFLSLAASIGKRPVLLVDNLQLVFERIAKVEQLTLRELLMRPGSPILIGASPTPLLDSQDYGAPFYDHFKTIYLKPLSSTEMHQLMLGLAEKTSRRDVLDEVRAHPERLKTLRDLTGGNPRTVVILFFLYAEDFSASVFADLQNLLDRVTPLYKGRIEELPEQQQVVVSAIADNWAPITARGVSEATGIAAASVSSQLDRLEQTGFIEKVEIFGQSSTGYQIAERFFNIWFLMRSASRRQRREVEFLVRFIETFYDPKDRKRLAQRLMDDRSFGPAQCQLLKALSSTLQPLDKDELDRHTELEALRQKGTESRRAMEEVFDFSKLTPATLAFDDLRAKLMALVPMDAGVAPEEFAKKVLGDRHIFVLRDRERVAATDAPLSKDKLDTLLKSVDDAARADEFQFGTEAAGWFRKRIATGQIRTLDNLDDWNRTFSLADSKPAATLLVSSIPPWIASKLSNEAKQRTMTLLAPETNSPCHVWRNWAHFLSHRLGWINESEQALRTALTSNPKCACALNDLGPMLSDALNRPQEAEAAFRKSLDLSPENATTWSNLGSVLQYRLGRYDESESAYRRGLEINPKDAYAWNALGNLLHYHLGRYKEAEAAYRRSNQSDPRYPLPWIGLAILLHNHLADYNEAEFAYRRAIEYFPSETTLRVGLGNLYRDHLRRYKDSASSYAKAIEIDAANESARENQVFLLRDFVGDMQAATSAFAPVRSSQMLSDRDVLHLQEALFAAYDANWGFCKESLAKAIDLIGQQFPARTSDHWFLASAVLLHLNYGDQLLRFLQDRSEDSRSRQWYESLSALQQGDRRYLQNIPVEMRATSEYYFDQIDKCLKTLPAISGRRPTPLASARGQW